MEKTSKLKKVINIISSVLFTIIILMVAFVAIFSLLTKSKNKVPFIGNVAFIRVLSDSMKPTFKEGDYIVIKKVNPDDLKEGDVITFVSSDPSIKGMLNTHGILRIEDGKFITKGVNNQNEDSYPVSKTDVVGKFVYKLTFLSAVLNFMSSPIGFILLILIPMLIIISLYIVDFIKAVNQKKLDDQKEKEQKLLDDTIKEMKENGQLEKAIEDLKNKDTPPDIKEKTEDPNNFEDKN